MRILITAHSRILTPDFLLGTLITASIVLTAHADLTNCTPPPSGLVGWWRGEGDCLDAAGMNNGTLQGGATFAVGEVGGAFSFNPQSGTMIVPDSPSLRLTNQLTIEAWIYARTVNTYPGYGIVSKIGGAPDGTQNFGYQFGMAGSTLFGQFSSPGDSWVQWPSAKVASDSLIVPGVWYHVAWTYDQSAMKLYCNGQPVATNVIGPKTISATSSNLRLSGDDNNHVFFDGLIDEASVYNRALTDAEIQAIYSAGSAGKCVTPVPPSIYRQPSSQGVTVGANVSLSVGASGTSPLAYQWQFSGTNVAGAVTSALALTSVQDSDAGSYTVVVTNAYGAVTSSIALLTVNPVPPCAPAPSGLVSWWRGEGNAFDEAGSNVGTLSGGVAFTTGEVGQAFSFNPTTGGSVIVPDSPSLRLTNQLTIEAWINTRRTNSADRSIVSKVGGTWGNNNGYQLVLSGNVLMGQFNSPGLQWPSWRVQCALLVATGTWCHAAWTYDQSAMTLYWNGQPVATNVIGPHPIAASISRLRIGDDDDGNHTPFDGQIDDPALYARALSAPEIAAIYAAGASGKCLTPRAPYIYAQPTDQAATVGGSVTFNVGVAGTLPLSYQWSYGGSAIDGATNAALTLTNVQFNQAGDYSVVITNVVGTAASSNATLSVVFPPALVRAVNVTNAHSGNTVTLPVFLAANGKEIGLSFSLNFDTTKLTYVSAALGSGASGATLLTNATQAAAGKLGVLLALPVGQTFAAGTQEVVDVTFMAAVRTTPTSTTVSFGDFPIDRQLSDSSGNTLAATYASSLVTILAVDLEGDISPRPNGDKAVTLTDWVLEGRFVAGLDSPTNTAEFQRADCAPRSMLGDGEITVIDWVQVGLYAAHLDPLTAAGGPTNGDSHGGIVSKSGSTPVSPHDVTCVLEIPDMTAIQGQTGTASVQLDSLGGENALGFSLAFDPAALNYVSASLGSASNGVTMFVNDSQAVAGRLGFVLGLGTGRTFASGARELVRVTFRTATGAKGAVPISFTNQPVVCEVSDTSAGRLAAGYVDGTVIVNPLPPLSIGRSGEAITLAWPLWATNFGLQAATGVLSPTMSWTNLSVAPTLTSNQAIVNLPLAATNVFYRLHQR